MPPDPPRGAWIFIKFLDLPLYNPPPKSKCLDLPLEIVSMLQQQQAVLQKVLKGQEAMSLRQDAIEGKISSLEVKVEKYNTTSPSSSSDGKRKRVVTRTLSVS